MGRKAKRDAADGARSSTRGSVKRVKTAGGTKVEIHDVWKSGVLVTTVSRATLY